MNSRLISARIALTKYLVPPYNTKTYFVSAMVMSPVQVQFKTLAGISSQKSRLLAVMADLKTQYTEYLSNPHLPHLLAARLSLTQTASSSMAPPPKPNPYRMVQTNLGVVEQSCASTFCPDGDRGQAPVLDVLKLVFGHRMSLMRP